MKENTPILSPITMKFQNTGEKEESIRKLLMKDKKQNSDFLLETRQ